jgi:hypothetical protein
MDWRKNVKLKINNVLQQENFTVAALQQVMQMTVMHGFHQYSCGCELNMKVTHTVLLMMIVPSMRNRCGWALRM